MNSKVHTGFFVISLDFELYWGVRDHYSIDQYKENLTGAYGAIIGMLALFEKYDIHATWAIVGMLYCKNYNDLIVNSPNIRPTYDDKKISPYTYIELNPHLESIFHYAPNTIGLIKDAKYQDIASHTFSHYYTQERGQTIEQFQADIKSNIEIAKRHGIDINSIVFPRNQYSKEHLSILSDFGISSYRGTDKGEVGIFTSLYLKRAFRLIDSYINLTGFNSIKLRDVMCKPYNIQGSRFFRPYAKRGLLEDMKISRIKKSMLYAAKHGKMYHLWWHPHNFGKFTVENLSQLEELLKYFKYLNMEYGFNSVNMSEVSKEMSCGKN